MADGHAASQLAKDMFVEHLGHETHAFVGAELAIVAGDDAGAFLAAVLQGVEAVVAELGSARVPVNAEHATVVLGVEVLWARIGLGGRRAGRVASGFVGIASHARIPSKEKSRRQTRIRRKCLGGRVCRTFLTLRVK